MTRILNVAKWFSGQKLAVKISFAIFVMCAAIAGLTYLLISNYRDQRIEDKETIKGLRLQLEVKDVNHSSELKRIDSIHTLEINNERLTTKAWMEKTEKEQMEMEQFLLDQLQIAKTK